MAGETLGEVLRRIGRRAGLEGVLALTDAQLLERFAAGRDEPAFAALVVRHGPMVLGVCRRLLRDAGHAEDAFQAAFLVLARKAGAVQRRTLLSAWLYGVACKVAARLRGREWKRQAREKPGDCDAVPAAAEPDSSDYPAIHEEVRRLPDKYREPVLLCYLEGKTHEEAARLLDWPLGTVKGRLARARDLLRSRLARRGVGPCEGPWPNALAVAAPAPALVDATIRAAPLFAAGDVTAGGLASARALGLSQGVLRTMILTNWKIAAALGLAAALLAGTGGYFYQTAAREPGAAPKSAANADKPLAADKAKEDKDAIQGVWQVADFEFKGKGPDEGVLKKIKAARWVITADKVVVQTPGEKDSPASYQLDPSKTPKEIDLTPQGGPPQQVIYSLEGDVLKICAPGPEGGPRPTEFAAQEGGKTAVLTLKREKPDQDKPNEAKPKDDDVADEFSKFRRLPRDAQTILEQAEQLEIYSLNPPSERGEQSKDKDAFHGFKVLGKTTVKDAAVCKKLVDVIEKGIANGIGAAGCFNPRHGLRATHDGKTVDLVICFECTGIEVFTGPERSFVWTDGESQETFDKVLRDADVPLAPKPK